MVIIGLLSMTAQIARSAPITDGRACQTAPDPQWSATEAEIWTEKLCKGEVVNFTTELETTPTLSARFLRSVLLHDPWRSAITLKGVQIIGAHFEEPLDLENAEIAFDLILDKCIFTKPVLLATSNLKGDLSFADSQFSAKLDLERINAAKSVSLNGSSFSELTLYGGTISKDLRMDHMKSSGEVNLIGLETTYLNLQDAELHTLSLIRAKVATVDLSNARISDLLQMQDANVGGSMFVQNAKVHDAKLNSAKLGGNFFMNDAEVLGTIEMDSVTIGSHLILTNTTASNINLSGARITGNLNMEGTRSTVVVDLDSATIGSNLLLRNIDGETINLNFCKVGGFVFAGDAQLKGPLQMNGADFPYIDLTGAKLAAIKSTVAKFATADLSGVAVSGSIEMWDTSVSSSLILRDSNSSEIVLSAIKIAGNLNLEGAKVVGNLNIDASSIGSNLAMKGVEAAEANLTAAKVGNIADISGATIKGLLSLRTAEASNLQLSDSSFGALDLTSAKIASSADISNVTVSGPINMASAAVGAGLHLPNIKATDVALGNSKIGGMMRMDGATISGKLDADGVDIGADIALNDSDIRVVSLNYARIRNNAVMDRVIISDVMDMQNAEVGANLFLRRAEIRGKASLDFITVGALWLAGATLSELDLTGSTMKGELTLSSEQGGAVIWSGDVGQLTLRNAMAGVIQGEINSWPKQMDLRGFRYRGLGGLGASAGDMMEFSEDDFLRWISRSRPFSPQPYEQLAHFLSENGYGEISRAILFSAREGERELSWRLGQWFSWITKTGSLVFIGHSYRPYYILTWVIGFIVLGAAVLSRSGEAKRLKLGTGLAFSFDRLIPLVHLEDKHYKVKLTPKIVGYFYFHQIMGYVFGLFLVGWLSGLLK